MAVTLFEQQSPPAEDAPFRDAAALRGLQRKLLQRTLSARSKSELLSALVDQIGAQAPLVAAVYLPHNDRGDLADAVRLYPAADNSSCDRFTRQLAAACQSACRTGELELRQQMSPSRTLLAAPVAQSGRDAEALGMMFDADRPVAELTLIVQLVVSHIAMWHALAGRRDSEADACDSAALVELLQQVTAAPDLRHACHALAGELQTYLLCGRVAVGVRCGGQGRCRLAAISGVAQFDGQSPAVQAIEAAMDEAVLRDEFTAWPPVSDDQRHAALAHKRLCSLDDLQAAVGVPLRGKNGQAVGALVLLGDTSQTLTHATRFLRAAETSLATSLAVAQRLEGGFAIRLSRAVARLWRSWNGKAILALVAILSAALAIPRPYKVSCSCQVEPVRRRFVATPFEGTLEKSFVKPGQIVREGDLLARLDGREIRWKRAAVLADRNQAVKKRDTAQAAHDYAEQQIAQLEVERQDLELQLLDHRAENLEIKSPIAGIVVSGDLERTEGAPVTSGQLLFEIAPLEKMIVEVAVPDDEVAFIVEGQSSEITWMLTPTNPGRRSWPDSSRDQKSAISKTCSSRKSN